MTIKPPLEDRTATGPEFEALYVEHDFDAILPHCETYIIEDRYYPDGHPSQPGTIQKHGKKYRLNGETVAVVFYYTHANGTVTKHFRMLRVDGVTYRAPVQPPVTPRKC